MYPRLWLRHRGGVRVTQVGLSTTHRFLDCEYEVSHGLEHFYEPDLDLLTLTVND